MVYKFSKIKKGFSLVELLIVLAIITIMTGVLFASNNNKKKAQSDVEAAARQVAAQIRALQNESLNGKMIGTKYANKFQFSAVNASSQYTITYIDGAGATLGTPQNFPIKKVSFDLPAGNLFFVSPNGQVNSSKSIGIKAVDGTENWICVSANGSVTEQKTVCP